MFWLYAVRPIDIEHFNAALGLANYFLTNVDLPPYAEQPFTSVPTLTSVYVSPAMEEHANIYHQEETMAVRWQNLKEYEESLEHPCPAFRECLTEVLFPPLNAKIKMHKRLAAAHKLSFFKHEIVHITMRCGDIIVTSLCMRMFTFQYTDTKYYEREMRPEHLEMIKVFAKPIRVPPIGAIAPIEVMHDANQCSIQCEEKLLPLIEALQAILNEHQHLPSEEIKDKFIEEYQEKYGPIYPELQNTHTTEQLLETIKQLVQEKKREIQAFIAYAQTHLLT